MKEKDKFLVKKNNKGYAVYAKVPFKKGDLICVFKGKVSKAKDIKYTLPQFIEAVDLLQISFEKLMKLDKPYLYFNHSCDPNSALTGVSSLIAIRNIKKGEEIVYDYSLTVAESFTCLCGAKNCRGAFYDSMALPKILLTRFYRMGALQDHVVKAFVEKNHGLCPCGSGKMYKTCGLKKSKQHELLVTKI